MDIIRDKDHPGKDEKQKENKLYLSLVLNLSDHTYIVMLELSDQFV